MLKPTKILVPTDFSNYSAKAFERAVDIAKKSEAELVLFHVVDWNIQACSVDYCLQDDEAERRQKAMLEGAQERLRKEVAKSPLPSEVKISTEVREGIPYEEILKFQDLNKVDLIIIASQGRSAIAKYFLGSVSSHVLKGAKCEVLLVK